MPVYHLEATKETTFCAQSRSRDISKPFTLTGSRGVVLSATLVWITRRFVHLVYIDEVKYDPPSQPFYWLGALAFPETAVQGADRAMSAIANAYFSTEILDQVTEFHARDILHGKGPYKGRPLHNRVALYKQLIDVIDQTEGVGRIQVRIDPSKMVSASYKDKAFMFLVEKIDEYMQTQESLALLVADYDREIAGANVRSLSAYKARGTDYAFGRAITRVVDTIHHTVSRDSRLLQLADVYVYTLCMVVGECDAYPRSELAAHAKSKSHFLFPTKYKDWPTDQSWYRPG